MRKTAWEILEESLPLEHVEILREMGVSFRGKTIYIQTEDHKTHKITTTSLAYYYAYDARNITSGCRSLGSITGDWRPIDNLARTCLQIYKLLKIQEMRRESKKLGLTPKF